MQIGIKFLIVFAAAAVMTGLVFIGFSKLAAPISDLRSVQTGTVKGDYQSVLAAPDEGDRIPNTAFVMEPMNPLYEPYRVKPFTKFPEILGPNIAPVPICDFGDFSDFYVPEQTVVKVSKPDFRISPIELKSRFLVTDRDPPTCPDGIPFARRFPAIMPAHATKSGRCDMEFQINRAGAYTNIKVVSCSESMFAKPSIEAMKKWRKNICGSENENEIDTDLVRTISVTYRLVDENGKTIPE